MGFYCNRNQATLFKGYDQGNSAIKITKDSGGIAINTPYNSEFVSELKSRVPFQNRAWDNDLKVWRVGFAFAQVACNLVEEIYGYCPEVDLDDNSDNLFQSQTYLIEYVGRCKQRDADGESIAMGFCQNAWNIIFPEKVLREFFDGKNLDDEDADNLPNSESETASVPAAPKQPRILTYYQLLGLKQSIEQSAIKKAYWRMARQWHPDVCREADARERFEAIQKAYAVLGEPMMRKRYDAGLAFEREAKKAMRNTNRKSNANLTVSKIAANFGYASPLRCGIVTIDGEYAIGKIIVSKIHNWDDWIENGKTAVASWNMATMSIETIWI